MKIIITIILGIFLVGCNSNSYIAKRKYTNGYYIAKSKTVNQKNEKPNSKLNDTYSTNQEVSNPNTNNFLLNNNIELEASSNNIPIIKNPKKQPLITFKKEEPCDVLVLKDGTEINVKIIEISPNEVKYKKCDTSDGPLVVANKSDVFMVKYANGTKEVFKAENQKSNKQPKQTSSTNSSTSKQNNDGKETEGFAIVSLIFGILGLFFFGSILGIIFGNMSLKKIKAEPEKYKGEEMATIGKILGIVGLILKILVVILYIAVVIIILGL